MSFESVHFDTPLGWTAPRDETSGWRCGANIMIVCVWSRLSSFLASLMWGRVTNGCNDEPVPLKLAEAERSRPRS